MEYARLPAIRELVEDSTALVDDTPPALCVVFTRTVSNAASTTAYRELVAGDGVRVLGPTVARLERFAQAYGSPIVDAADTAYGEIVAELLAPDAE